MIRVKDAHIGQCNSHAKSDMQRAYRKDNVQRIVKKTPLIHVLFAISFNAMKRNGATISTTDSQFTFQSAIRIHCGAWRPLLTHALKHIMIDSQIDTRTTKQQT